MTKEYDQQDGAPQTRPDSNETVKESAGARPATIGERSTEENVAGQGLGQMSEGEADHRAPGTTRD